MSFVIAGFQKTTLLDYPEKIACIVFTQGCNFKCGYCHNPELFEKKEPVITLPALFEFLKSRTGKLDGVVITGGEPTLQKELKDFIKEIKSLDFLVKLDTNGTNPDIIEELLKEKLIDYIAMDIKAPIEKYPDITNTNVNKDQIQRSINIILNSKIDYEFRTTAVREQLDIEDFKQIGTLISGAKRYYIQKFVPDKILDKSFKNNTSLDETDFKTIKNLLKEDIEVIELR